MTLWPSAPSTRLRTVKDNGTIFAPSLPMIYRAKALVARHLRACWSAGKTLRSPTATSLTATPVQGTEAGLGAAGGKVGPIVSFDPQQASFDSEAGQIVEPAPDAYW